MCGFACTLGEGNLLSTPKVFDLLKHRGPDDNGTYIKNNIALYHTRLSILDLSLSGHQPMRSTCGRYIIAYNGEIYNHLDLRKRFLSDHSFRGHSDTETLIELFSRYQENMLQELVGMWAMVIWDEDEQRLFISRDRYGQKPLYYRNVKGIWNFSSEITPLLYKDEQAAYNATAVADFLALGNYGHLGRKTFFSDIEQFPPGSYSWLVQGDKELISKKYWDIPYIPEKEKRPFDAVLKKEMHDIIVESVLSQTLSDVPIGITLSGGIDSSVITGILATYLDTKIHVFTAQSANKVHDESKYIHDLCKKYGDKLHVTWLDLKELRIQEDIERYIRIQEEPFGDPSIIAHGLLMGLAANAGVKVILGGQGADELFFGYTNMVQASLLKQFRHGKYGLFFRNMEGMGVGVGYKSRAILQSIWPGLERELRILSRKKRRRVLNMEMLGEIDDSLFTVPNYKNSFDVWKESIYGIHLPHLVQYDDRNAMASSIEGRMPFLDHRVAMSVAKIRIEDLFVNGYRKYPLRESCKEYLPESIYRRKDKIGFYTPLIDAIYNDNIWIADKLKNLSLINKEVLNKLLQKQYSNSLNINDALYIWRFLSLTIWTDIFNVKHRWPST